LYLITPIKSLQSSLHYLYLATLSKTHIIYSSGFTIVSYFIKLCPFLQSRRPQTTQFG